jgi:hypothetical protein
MLTEKHTIIGTTPRMRSAPPCTVLQSKHWIIPSSTLVFPLYDWWLQ